MERYLKVITATVCLQNYETRRVEAVVNDEEDIPVEIVHPSQYIQQNTEEEMHFLRHLFSDIFLSNKQ